MRWLMNTKLSAQVFGLGLLLAATACGSRTSLMQDDGGVADAGEQTSGVTTSLSGGRGGTTTTARAGSGAAGRGGLTGSAGGMGRPGRGQAGGAAAGKGGSAAEGGQGGGKASTGGTGGEKAPDEGGKGGAKAADEGGKGGEGGETEQGGEGGQGGQGGEGGEGGEQAGAGGAPAAGSGGATGSSLSMLSAEQKTSLCARVEDGTKEEPVSDAVRGYCASLGLRQPDMCAEVRDTCFDGNAVLPVCADTVPDCADITEDEFVSCRVDDIKRFVAYNSVITCSDPNSIPAGTSDPASCVSVYERCPQLRSLSR